MSYSRHSLFLNSQEKVLQRSTHTILIFQDGLIKLKSEVQRTYKKSPGPRGKNLPVIIEKLETRDFKLISWLPESWAKVKLCLS
jgi:hypothetical protein